MAEVRATAPVRVAPGLTAAATGILVAALVGGCLLRPSIGLYVTEGIGLVAALLAAGLAFFVAVLASHTERAQWARIVLPVALVGFAFALLSVGFDIAVVAGNGLAGITDASARDVVLRGGDYESALARCFGLSVVALGFAAVRSQRYARFTLCVGGLIVAGSFLLMGHVRTHHPVGLVAVCALAHVVAASAWLGGVVGLGAALRTTSYDVQARGRVVATFAGLMTGVLVMLLAGGAGLAFLYLPSADAFVSTAYGQVLLVKLGLVAALLVVSASNHLRLVPAARNGHRVATTVLGMNVAVEQIVLMTLLLVTEVLMRQSPT